jgi:hypothetical protein
MGDRPLRSKWPVILFIMVLWGVLTAHAGENVNSGSFYIGKMNAHIKWGMNTGVTKDSVFSIQIDNLEPDEITTEKDAHIKNLDTGARHLVKISLDGVLRESFWFDFAKFQCDRLWLYFKPMYGTWVLRESSYNCKR